MAEIGLDLEHYAEALGEAHAIIHCVAKFNAQDVEFVFGSALFVKEAIKEDSVSIKDSSIKEDSEPVWASSWQPNNSTAREASMPTNTPTDPPHKYYPNRRIQLYCIDFNQCQPIQFNDAGLASCYKAIRTNDKYTPRPADTVL
ncbi:uncharacterized protein AB675_7485 [Cyphellophora attinorum]|uniref:DUF3669 domain-containing protein n=1 Tax=Cyphellophora attinorum TaxID=1664694 RepID=A0A0N1HBC5_9EURO|nr:uncharacterized protein AB675_7485 [Phialophora attinorum]KPI40504.1 hypothetical protein AB675_7485 [Phialophora attinorum]